MTFKEMYWSLISTGINTALFEVQLYYGYSCVGIMPFDEIPRCFDCNICGYSVDIDKKIIRVKGVR